MNETSFLNLIAGRTRGIGALLLRGGLAVLSLFYRGGVALRSVAFQLGIKKIYRVDVPVISVGNITTGGAGKTPFVAYLADWYSKQSEQVVLLSRGYRALPGEVNDEKLVLDQLCPNVLHLQNPNRVESAKRAIAEHEATVLILDDGFQHRRLHRNLDIVLIDTLNPFGYNHLLPRGLLREPLAGLKRADMIVLTRADQCSAEDKTKIIQTIARIRGNDDHVEIMYPPTKLINYSREFCHLETFKTKPIAAFCGIGNPAAFREMLERIGYNIVLFQPFADHHHYTQTDITFLAKKAKQAGAVALLTTQKDIVKLNQPEEEDLPIWAVQIGTKLLSGEKLLEEKLLGTL